MLRGRMIRQKGSCRVLLVVGMVSPAARHQQQEEATGKSHMWACSRA
jgi:hypothetical protein